MPFDPCAPAPAPAAEPAKGLPVLVCQGQALAGPSPAQVDCSRWNAVHFDVTVTGGSLPVALAVEGSYAQQGLYLPLPDPQASQTVTGTTSFDVVCGALWAQVRLGPVPAGQAYTIWATPYNAAGPASVRAEIVCDSLSAINVDTGALNVSDVLAIGPAGGIYQGTGSFASPGTGLKVWSEGGVGRIAGYNDGQEQAGFAADGRLQAGGGAVQVDASGLAWGQPGELGSRLGLDAGGSVWLGYVAGTPTTPHVTFVSSGHPGGAEYDARLVASGGTGHQDGNLYAKCGEFSLPVGAWLTYISASPPVDVHALRVSAAGRLDLGYDAAAIVLGATTSLPATDAQAQQLLTALNAALAATLDWARVSKVGSDLADLAARSHSSLTDIGANSHAAIDTFLGDAQGAWSSWAPTFGAAGAMTYTGVSASLARYKQIGKLVWFQIAAQGTTGGTPSKAVQFSLPVAPPAGTTYITGPAVVLDGAASGQAGYWANDGANALANVYWYDARNWGTGSGRAIIVSGCYEAA